MYQHSIEKSVYLEQLELFENEIALVELDAYDARLEELNVEAALKERQKETIKLVSRLASRITELKANPNIQNDFSEKVQVFCFRLECRKTERLAFRDQRTQTSPATHRALCDSK